MMHDAWLEVARVTQKVRTKPTATRHLKGLIGAAQQAGGRAQESTSVATN